MTGKYRNIVQFNSIQKIKLFNLVSLVPVYIRGSGTKSGNISNMDNKVEAEPRADEPLPEPEPETKRPPYKCGKFNTKFEKAEEAVDCFNASRKSLDSVLKVFAEHKDAHKDVPALLEVYKSVQEKYLKTSKTEKRCPLIVMEGLDGCGKSTVGMRLAKKLCAERVTTPPKSMSPFREKFDGHYCLHAPFYYLGNYVAAMEVANILENKPVIMDRFWHSTTAFALAQLKEDYWDVKKSTELPEKNNEVYEWPEDLLKPDVVIFLDVPEDVRNERLSRRTSKTEQEKLLTSKEDFRKSVLLAYDNMVNPHVHKVNGNKSFKSVLEEIVEVTRHLF